MTLKSALLAGTAAVLLASGAWAQATHPVTGEALSDNQTFTYRVLDEFPSIDPNLIEDVEGSAVGRNLFEGLLSHDATGGVVPGVATDYDVSDDGLVYTFHLRPEAMWSDGKPVTAGDFVYESPGEGHTLVAYEHKDPMKVFFIVTGPLIWLDENGASAGHFDVHDYIALCRAHYFKVGLGTETVDALFR